MTAVLIFVLMFLAAFAAAALAVSFVYAFSLVRARQAGQAGAGFDELDPGTTPALLKSDQQLSTIRVWGNVLARFSQVQMLSKMIGEAGLDWSAGRVTLAMLLAGAATGALLNLFSWIPGWMSVAATLLAAMSPYLHIRARRARRFQRFASQFPEALDSLTRALKAGYPLPAAIELLGAEQPEPLAGEMRRTRDEWKLGVSWDHALDNLAARIPTPEVRLFAAAVKMQNRIGGRLNDVLARVGEGMRDAAMLESEVRAISVHSRMTGLVLTLLPVAILAVMLAVNPGYVLVLTQSPAGQTMIYAAVFANVLAHVVIRKLSRIRI